MSTTIVPTLQNNIGQNELSFDRGLRHAYTPLKDSLDRNNLCLDNIVDVLRQRIQAEIDFARTIERIISSCNFTSLEAGKTIRDGLESIRADMKNEYNMRVEFANSLSEDVYKPLLQCREIYNLQNQKFAQDTKTNVKTLRNEHMKWLKLKSRYEKTVQEAQQARHSLLDSKSDPNISTSQVVKLGLRVNATTKQQLQMQEKYNTHKTLWDREQIRFDETMTTILQGMQLNEDNRLQTLQDCLNKWAIFITNLTANRNYDVKHLADVMVSMDAKEDLQSFMKDTLKKHPPKYDYKSRLTQYHQQQKETLIATQEYLETNNNNTLINNNNINNHIKNISLALTSQKKISSSSNLQNDIISSPRSLTRLFKLNMNHMSFIPNNTFEPSSDNNEYTSTNTTNTNTNTNTNNNANLTMTTTTNTDTNIIDDNSLEKGLASELNINIDEFATIENEQKNDDHNDNGYNDDMASKESNKIITPFSSIIMRKNYSISADENTFDYGDNDNDNDNDTTNIKIVGENDVKNIGQGESDLQFPLIVTKSFNSDAENMNENKKIDTNNINNDAITTSND